MKLGIGRLRFILARFILARSILTACLALAPYCVLVPQALALQAPAGDEHEAVELVRVPAILAPKTVDGRLRGYAYLSIELIPSSPAQILPIQQNMPFIQDAFLRELNRGNILLEDDPTTLDMDGTKHRLLARLEEILKPGMVNGLTITEFDIAPLIPQ